MVCRAGRFRADGAQRVLQGLQGVQHHAWRLLDRVLPLQLKLGRAVLMVFSMSWGQRELWLAQSWKLGVVDPSPGAVRFAGSLGGFLTKRLCQQENQSQGVS